MLIIIACFYLLIIFDKKTNKKISETQKSILFWNTLTLMKLFVKKKNDMKGLKNVISH